ncbi:hypothetical protein ACQ4PT_067657 [Festuca glaucescens]
MEAEAAALSQLQLQLLALVSDLRLTRERERAAREELHASSQRWKEAEEEHRREARELRAEVAARDDALRRLESRVKCLENDNEMLGRNEKDLKENMERLLQSREAFMKHYEACFTRPLYLALHLATATVECKSRIDTGSNQEQCPQSLKHSTIASPETVTETVEKPNCCHESKDIEMGNSSPNSKQIM